MLHSRRESSEAGFVLVDTLVAVIVISLILTVCLETVRIAGASSRNTRAATEARALLLELMETTPRIPGIYRGVGGTMSYVVSVTDSEFNNVRLCRLDARARSKSGRRTYQLTGTRWCASVRP